MDEHPSNWAARRLRVLVRLDSELQSARIHVQGTVTPENLQALYVVARRTNALLGGTAITIDLTSARAEDEALDRLRTSVSEGRLPASIDPFEQECFLNLLEPAPQ